MEIITQEMTYSIPDEYFTTSTDDGITGTVTYTGPDEIWVFVDRTTGKLNWSMHALANFDETIQELANRHAGEDHKAILVNFSQNPLICWAMFGEYDFDNASQKTYTLDGESEPYFTNPDPLPPQMIYDYPNFTYLFDSGTWRQPYPMVTPSWTQADIEEIIANTISDIESRIDSSDVSDSYTAALTATKTELEGLVAKYGPDGANVPYYMWPMPDVPTVDEFENGSDMEIAVAPVGDDGIVWEPAEDGSEGPGSASGYQPTDDTPTVTVDETAAETTPAAPDEALESTDVAVNGAE